MSLRLVIVAVLGLVLVACGDDDGALCSAGDEGCACYGNQTCNDGLTCIAASDLCVDLGDGGVGMDASAGTGGTAGSAGAAGFDGGDDASADTGIDATVGIDATTGIDAATGPDATVGTDAATGTDATVGTDAAVGTDATVGVDAGHDAGSELDAGADGGDDCDRVTAPLSRRAVDIIWIIDNSCSMFDEYTKVKANINAFAEDIVTATLPDLQPTFDEFASALKAAAEVA